MPDVLKPGEVQRVLQALLRERVPIRDLESILEAISEIAPRTKDTDILTEYARHALARTLCHLQKADDGRIHCITLDPKLEELISNGLERGEHGTVLTLPRRFRRRSSRQFEIRWSGARRPRRVARPCSLRRRRCDRGCARWLKSVFLMLS